MPHPQRVVVLLGSPSPRSRTQALASALVEAVAERVPVQVHWVELSALGPLFGASFGRDGLAPQARAALDLLEGADLLVAATPVYKGSYTGLFKHVIDLVHPEAWIGRPVLLAASGGGERHALVVEHQLRPLFGFFRAQTVPSAVYASEAELEGYVVSSAGLQARIDEAAGQAAALLAARRSSGLREATPALG